MSSAKKQNITKSSLIRIPTYPTLRVCLLFFTSSHPISEIKELSELSFPPPMILAIIEFCLLHRHALCCVVWDLGERSPRALLTTSR